MRRRVICTIGGVLAVLVIVVGVLLFRNASNFEEALSEWRRLGNDYVYLNEDLHVWLGAGTPVSDSERLLLRRLAPNIFRFVAEKSQISDADLECLSAATKLWSLDLDYTEINGSGFASLRDCSELKTISARKSQLNDVGVSHIARIPSYLSVNLEYCPITVEGLSTIFASENLHCVYLFSPESISLEALESAVSNARHKVFVGYLNLDGETKARLVRDAPENVTWIFNDDP
jgi:hypothetical protein